MATGKMAEDPRQLAQDHAREAERLLASRFLSSHVKGQLHATLALYYSTQARDRVEVDG